MAEETHTQGAGDVSADFFSTLAGESVPEPDTPPEPEVEVPPVEPETPPEELKEPDTPPEIEAQAEPEKVEFNIKDHFPEYDDIESVKMALAKSKGLPGEEEILTLKEKAELFEQYEKKFSSLKESGLSPELVRLQLAEKTDPDKAALYKKLLYGDPTDLEMIKLGLISQDPELKDDSEMLDYQLEKRYPEVYGPDADPDSDEYKKALRGIKYDAMRTRKRIKGEFESMEVPEYPDPVKADEKVKEIIKTWQPHFAGHKEEITTVNVEMPGEKGTEKLIDIKIPESDTEKYTKAAVNFIASQGLSYSKVSLQKVKDVVKGMYLGENLLAYNKAIYGEAEKRATESFRKGVHNPKEAETEAKQTVKSDDEDFNRLLDAME